MDLASPGVGTENRTKLFEEKNSKRPVAARNKSPTLILRSWRRGAGPRKGNSEKVLAGELGKILAKMGVLAGVLAHMLAGSALCEHSDNTGCQHLCQHSGQHSHFCQQLCQLPPTALFRNSLFGVLQQVTQNFNPKNDICGRDSLRSYRRKAVQYVLFGSVHGALCLGSRPLQASVPKSFCLCRYFVTHTHTPCTHTHRHTYIRTYIYIYKYTHPHAHTHTHTHIYIYIYIYGKLQSLQWIVSDDFCLVGNDCRLALETRCADIRHRPRTSHLESA